MAVLKRRTRIVSFRVSEEEFEQLQNRLVDKGAHSLSDFVRAALARLNSGEPEPNRGRSELRALTRRLLKLETHVQQLAQLVDATQVNTFCIGKENTAFSAPAGVQPGSPQRHPDTTALASAAAPQP